MIRYIVSMYKIVKEHKLLETKTQPSKTMGIGLGHKARHAFWRDHNDWQTEDGGMWAWRLPETVAEDQAKECACDLGVKFRGHVSTVRGNGLYMCWLYRCT